MFEQYFQHFPGFGGRYRVVETTRSHQIDENVENWWKSWIFKIFNDFMKLTDPITAGGPPQMVREVFPARKRTFPKRLKTFGNYFQQFQIFVARTESLRPGLGLVIFSIIFFWKKIIYIIFFCKKKIIYIIFFLISESSSTEKKIIYIIFFWWPRKKNYIYNFFLIIKSKILHKIVICDNAMYNVLCHVLHVLPVRAYISDDTNLRTEPDCGKLSHTATVRAWRVMLCPKRSFFQLDWLLKGFRAASWRLPTRLGSDLLNDIPKIQCHTAIARRRREKFQLCTTFCIQKCLKYYTKS